MTPLFMVSYGALWLIVAVLVILVLLVLRQLGLASMTPRERIGHGGVAAGELLPRVAIELSMLGSASQRATHDAEPVVSELIWTASQPGKDHTVVVIGGADCPICKQLWPEVENLPAERTDIDWIWLDSASRDGQPPDGWTYAISPDLEAHRILKVPMLPFAYVLDAKGRVISKGLVNRSDEVLGLLTKTNNSPAASGKKS